MAGPYSSCLNSSVDYRARSVHSIAVWRSRRRTRPDPPEQPGAERSAEDRSGRHEEEKHHDARAAFEIADLENRDTNLADAHADGAAGDRSQNQSKKSQ